MAFEFFAKDNDNYHRMIQEIPSGCGWQFVKSLTLSVEGQIQNMRNDILGCFNKGDYSNLKHPKHSDPEIQKKLDILSEMRRINIVTLNELNQLIETEEFIICEWCRNKMYKFPNDVLFEKIGDRIIIKGEQNNIKYSFICSNPLCHLGVNEDCHNRKLQNIKKREELLAAGKTFVPDEFGFWHYIDS